MRSRVLFAVAAGFIAVGAAGCGGGHRHGGRHPARTSSTAAGSASIAAPATPAPAAGVSIAGPPPPAHRAAAVAYLTGGPGPAGVRLNGRRLSVAGDKGATAVLVAPTGQLLAIASGSTGRATLQLDRPDGSVYLTMSSAASSVVPLAWSPDARYLALGLHNGPAGGTFEVLDTRTGALAVKQSGRTERASFAPGETDVVCFDLDHSHIAGHPSPDIWSAVVGPGPGDDSGAGPITHDGRSANPLRIRAGIVYDAVEELPGFAHLVYEVAIWGHTTIHPVRAPDAAERAGGLVAIAASADGHELVATPRLGSGVYLIDSVTRKVRTVSTAPGIAPAGISRDGRQLLVTVASGPERSAIATMPAAGGTLHVIAPGGTAPSWNR